jgi:Uma2 family endonuclease
LERTPLLLVEVGSRSTRLVDLGTKRLAYEAAGVPEYWLVDPDGPSLTVLRLVDGRYEEAAKVTDDEPYVATYPFPVTIVASRLGRPRRNR